MVRDSERTAVVEELDAEGLLEIGPQRRRDTSCDAVLAALGGS